MEANIFRGLAGEVWIDQAQERLTRLDAHVIANVDFGWGILGKLDKGGTIQLEQSDIGNRDWQLTTLKLNLKGKALLIKALNIQLTDQPILPQCPRERIIAKRSTFCRTPNDPSPTNNANGENEGCPSTPFVILERNPPMHP